MKKDPTEIIIRPIISEKSTLLKEKNRVLCFKVNGDANKIEIKRAVEDLFRVRVENVRIENVLGKIKRWGRYSGKRPDWKKAYVKLKEGEKMVEFVEGV
ncbi:MAG: 50S ribosomal protein L23 [Acidobacteriota bacterium]